MLLRDLDIFSTCWASEISESEEVEYFRTTPDLPGRGFLGKVRA